MASHRPLRLGTRGSLLALAQSRLVARALRTADPGRQIDIHEVTTRGDVDLMTPLTAVQDPGFFSTALDDALRAGEVDFCVHSVKDLPPPAARPGIHTAAITAREDPRDVIVFRSTITDRLRCGLPVRIGSSSARRMTHVRRFLADALPHLRDSAPVVSFQPLRGAVETRLQRTAVAEDTADALDGVVLALAGLQRLWSDRTGHAAIARLLATSRLMVLPLSECPVAPGQGALSIDCRVGDARTIAALSVLNDPATTRRVRRETSLLAAQPEERRQEFAATTVRHPNCGTVMFVRTATSGDEPAHVIWQRPPRPAAAQAWDGGEWVRATHYQPLPVSPGDAPAVFVAHWRALAPGMALSAATRIWVSGAQSWRRLAARGLWVEGCADNLGFEAITTTLQLPVLRLPPLAEWTALTRTDAVESWRDAGVGRVLATYSIGAPEEGDTLAQVRRDVMRATHFFWGSATQFRALRPWLPATASHACGPGKTYNALRADGVAGLQAFPSRAEWQRWLA